MKSGRDPRLFKSQESLSKKEASFKDPSKMSPIPMRWGTSASAENKTNELVYNRQCKLFGESISHSLKLLADNETYALVPNYKKLTTPEETLPTVNPENKAYIFVIVKDTKSNDAGKLQLRIGMGSHYFLANKSEQVLAAGEVEFKDGKIIRITDQSGAYFLDKKQEIENTNFGKSIFKSMKKVGLPVDRIHPFSNEGALAQAIERHHNKMK